MKRLSLLFLILLLIALGTTAKSASLDREQLKWVRGRPVIDSIVVEGNQRFTDSEIKNRMYSRARNLLGWIKGDRRNRVQRETLGRDTLEIKYLYLTAGYLNPKVQESFELLPTKDSLALVRIIIDEGELSKYGGVTVSGSFDPKFGYDLNRIASALKESKPINYFDLVRIGQDMKTYLANRGYPYATISHRLDSTQSPGIYPVDFQINSDSMVYFGDVIINGDEQFPEKAARRELKIKKGNVYRRVDILDSQTRLFESGYYSTFSLEQAGNSSDRLKPNFELRLREHRPYFISFQTGVSQSQERDLLWGVSSSFGKRNLFGTRRIELLTDYSFGVGSDSRLLVHRYRARFTEPWFLGLRMPLALTGELNPKLRDATQDFKKQSWSFAAETAKRFGRKIKTILGFEYQSVDLSGIPEDEIESIKKQEGNSARRKLYFNIRRDSRDDLFVPRWGSVTTFSSDYFGGFLGGDDNFFKLEASWSRYQPFWPGWIAATRIKAGWTEEFGVSDLVPTDELLLVGGANTVRGFVENSLGPLNDDGDPLGARIVLVLNQEFRWKTIQFLNEFPLIGGLFKSMPLWQSIFVDMGNGFDNKNDIALSNFAYSYGTGFQLISPAGPIRIDYARRIPTSRYDFESRYHFTILYAF